VTFPSGKKWAWLVCAVSILLGLVVFLGVSQSQIGFGFPLDDAWIHQTYARNFAQQGEWAFLPGQNSAGSTGPLWSILISLAYWTGLPYLAWTYFLGGVSLMAISVLAGLWFARRAPEQSGWGWAVVVIVGLEWHLLWSALSGMETVVMALLSLMVLYMLESPDASPAVVGSLIGVGLWVRPDALLLLLPVAWIYVFQENGTIKSRIRNLCISLGAFSILVVPYLFMNYRLVGEIWPTTFFAKQAEYAFLRQEPLITRLINQVKHPLTGPGIVILPGIILELWHTWRRRSWSQLAPLLWVGAYLGAYAFRLPVTYQHGRYAMPVIPIMLVLGLSGMGRWLRLGSKDRVRRVISRTWAAVFVLVTAAFVGIGARAYATDVGVIETEMVAASLWIRDNTPSHAVIAAHDIGALGYFGQRQIVDLAGLVTPEVVPIIRNEAALADFMDDQGVDYFMSFPGWYWELTRGLPVVYTTQGEFSPGIDGENITVYEWITE
jgi:hypothetical protein